LSYDQRSNRGNKNFTWDATDATGKKVSSGIYFTRECTLQGKAFKVLTYIK